MLKSSDLERFFSKVRMTDSCWIWEAHRDKNGYGIFGLGGKNRRAHRVSFEIGKGPIPDGLYVLHNCPSGDNKSCVNWNHLWLGTDADNKKDAIEKSQMARGERNGQHTHPENTARGERNGRSRYNEAQILAIDRRLRDGDTPADISKEFGVPVPTIRMIKGGYEWGWLTGRPAPKRR